MLFARTEPNYPAPVDVPAEFLILIMHREQKQLVPYERSVMLHQKLTAQNVEARLISMPGGGHGFGGGDPLRLFSEFFKTALKRR